MGGRRKWLVLSDKPPRSGVLLPPPPEPPVPHEFASPRRTVLLRECWRSQPRMAPSPLDDSNGLRILGTPGVLGQGNWVSGCPRSGMVHSRTPTSRKPPRGTPSEMSRPAVSACARLCAHDGLDCLGES
eukprot:5235574-Prymnesium_polylepis.1